MKTLFHFLFILQISLSTSVFAQLPAFNWVNQIAGGFDDVGNDLAVDGDGNIYVTGTTNDSTTFYSTNGMVTLNDTGFATFFTVAKYDTAGNLLWNFKAGSYLFNRGLRIRCTNDDIVILGSYSDTIDVDPGPGVHNLFFGQNSPFVAKYNFSGQLLWSFGFNDTISIVSNDMTTNADGEIFLAGNFNHTVDFDPGAGVSNVTSQGPLSAYLAKYDAGGNFQWVKSCGGAQGCSAYHLMVDATGNIYSSGTFGDSVDFDPGAGVFFMYGQSDNYLMKLDQNGIFQWAFNLGDSINVGKIAEYAPGEILLTGGFSGTADFDPGIGVYNLTSNGDGDIYVACYSSGGQFLWAKNVGGVSSDYGIDITSNNSGNIYLTGAFQKDVDFDPGSGVTLLSSSGDEDIFIAAYDAYFNLIWVFNVGDTFWDNPSAIALDHAGGIIAVGQFMHQPDFNPSPEIDTTHFSCCRDIFVAKYHSSDLNGIATFNDENFLVYPNPFWSWLHLEMKNFRPGNYFCSISDALGTKQIFSFTAGQSAAPVLPLNSLSNGIYLLRVYDDAGKLVCVKKIIKQ